MPTVSPHGIALADHLSTRGCQPFPAGSVVPRWLTAPAESSLPWISPSYRARVAAQLVLAEHLRTRDAKSKISKLTSLTADAAQEWASRHPELDPAIHKAGGSPSPATVPAAALLHTLMALGCAQGGNASYEHAAEANFSKRLMHLHTKLTPKTQKEQPSDQLPRALKHRETPLDQLPFGAPTYRCQCQPPTAMPAPTPVFNTAVDQVLATPHGGWVLLGLFFLKQLHGHLAWPPNIHQSPEAHGALYVPARRALNALARSCSDTLHAPSAAGLARVLPMLLPPFDRVTGADTALPDDLPACFRPARLGPADEAARQACGLLQAQAWLAAQVSAVDVLAREVAALLTCPVSAPNLGLTALQCRQITTRHEHNLTRLRQAPGDGQPVPVQASPDFVRDHLIFRVKRLKVYSTWMGRAGLAASRQAQAATLCPAPRPATPGRPLEEESAP